MAQMTSIDSTLLQINQNYLPNTQIPELTGNDTLTQNDNDCNFDNCNGNLKP